MTITVSPMPLPRDVRGFVYKDSTFVEKKFLDWGKMDTVVEDSFGKFPRDMNRLRNFCAHARPDTSYEVSWGDGNWIKVKCISVAPDPKELKGFTL